MVAEESKAPLGPRRGSGGANNDPILAIFNEKLQQPKEEVPVPIAGVQTLLEVMSRSKAVTIMGIQSDLKEATAKLVEHEKALAKGHGQGNRASISFRAGVELFFRYVTRNNDEVPDFGAMKELFIARGERFVKDAMDSRSKIAELGHHFVRDGTVVLTHGRSEVVMNVLRRAAETKNFTVMVTEGRPEGSGFKAAERLTGMGIPVTVILDSAVGYYMERVDLVLLGAEGVVESGGIVNKIGTCQMAMAAKTYNKPLYVAAESYKFARLYPLTQADLETNIDNDSARPLLPPYYPGGGGGGSGGLSSSLSSTATAAERQPPQPKPEAAEEEEGSGEPQHTLHRVRSFSLSLGPAAVTTLNPSCDYTPANYISLLFTDLGILTPAAVSDELIKLYQ